eukprot:1212947-Rhodomonas_salina.1
MSDKGGTECTLWCAGGAVKLGIESMAQASDLPDYPGTFLPTWVLDSFTIALQTTPTITAFRRRFRRPIKAPTTCLASALGPNA